MEAGLQPCSRRTHLLERGLLKVVLEIWMIDQHEKANVAQRVAQVVQELVPVTRQHVIPVDDRKLERRGRSRACDACHGRGRRRKRCKTEHGSKLSSTNRRCDYRGTAFGSGRVVGRGRLRGGSGMTGGILAAFRVEFGRGGRGGGKGTRGKPSGFQGDWFQATTSRRYLPPRGGYCTVLYNTVGDDSMGGRRTE